MLSRKNWRGGLLIKNGTIDGYTNQPGYCPGRIRIYITRDPWHLGNFCNIFLQIYVKTKKLSLSDHRAPGTVPYYGTSGAIVIVLRS